MIDLEFVSHKMENISEHQQSFPVPWGACDNLLSGAVTYTLVPTAFCVDISVLIKLWGV